jgi:hypothetical protein
MAKFFFDQSSTYNTFAVDVLNSNEINVNLGGKQCWVHLTIISEDNFNLALHGLVQEINFPLGLLSDYPYSKFVGQPKGIRVILQEYKL